MTTWANIKKGVTALDYVGEYKKGVTYLDYVGEFQKMSDIY